MDIWEESLVKTATSTSGQMNHARSKTAIMIAPEGYPVASFHKGKVELSKKWRDTFFLNLEYSQIGLRRLIKFHCKSQNYNLLF